MPKTEAFEQHADQYDAWFETHEDAYEAELETIRQLMPAPDARGLEVGVGSGKFAVPLGIETGVEPSERMAAAAESLGINVYRSVAEDLPFADGEFDYVLMVTSICFVDDALKSFEEAYRVLKPGGCIIVGYVDKESELGRQYIDRRESSLFYKEATFFSSREIQAHLTEAGFRDVAFKQTLIPGEAPGAIRDGFGAGSFVAARGTK
jgi:SAM-dependent methyltransferase